MNDWVKLISDSTSSTNLKAWTITKDSKKHVQIDGEICPVTGATYTADDDHNQDASSQGRYDDGAEDEEDSLFAGDDQEDTRTTDSINSLSCRAGRGGVEARQKSKALTAVGQRG